MLSKLKMVLRPETEYSMSINMASAMHGVLMELIKPDYAEYLHADSMRPYSQYLSVSGEDMIWTVSALRDDAYENIIKVLLSDELDEIHLKRHDLKLMIASKEMTQMSEKDLSASFYREDSSRFIKIRFMSPTAFKQSGRYTFYPDLSCIYGSLMRRMDLVSDKNRMYDDDLLEELTRQSEIMRYDLRSVNYHLEGVKIPAFTGWIMIKVHGAQSLVNYVNMLMRFGEFSGTGIKTSLGMGAMKILKKQEKVNESKSGDNNSPQSKYKGDGKK